MSALALRREPKATGRSIRARSPRQQTVVKPNLAVVPRRRRWPAVIGALAWAALFAGLLGAAVFHTQLAERQLRIDRLDRAVAEQRELFDELRYQRAELRSPVRLAEAAGAMGMGRGDTSDFVGVAPEAVARQLAAAGTLDATSRVIVETDPLQQFRDVKAVTAGELSDEADTATADPADAGTAAADAATAPIAATEATDRPPGPTAGNWHARHPDRGTAVSERVGPYRTHGTARAPRSGRAAPAVAASGAARRSAAATTPTTPAARRHGSGPTRSAPAAQPGTAKRSAPRKRAAPSKGAATSKGSATVETPGSSKRAGGPERQAAARQPATAGSRSNARKHPPRNRVRVQAPPPRKRTPRRAGSPRFRLIAALVVIAVLLLVVVARVAALQTTEADAYRAQGAAQWTRTWDVPAQRGAIFDRNGNELSISVPAATISINPKLIDNGTATIQTLDDLLDLPDDKVSDLLAEIDSKQRGFVYVARQVDTALGDQISSLELPGVNVDREDRREMPGGETGRSIIGKTNIDGEGIAGLELQYDDLLSGTGGEMSREVAPGNRSIPGSETVTEAPIPGDDLVLTLDRSIQFSTEQVLLERVSEIGARGATAIVMVAAHGRRSWRWHRCGATTRRASTR